MLRTNLHFLSKRIQSNEKPITEQSIRDEKGEVIPWEEAKDGGPYLGPFEPGYVVDDPKEYEEDSEEEDRL